MTNWLNYHCRVGGPTCGRDCKGRTQSPFAVSSEPLASNWLYLHSASASAGRPAHFRSSGLAWRVQASDTRRRNAKQNIDSHAAPSVSSKLDLRATHSRALGLAGRRKWARRKLLLGPKRLACQLGPNAAGWRHTERPIG